MCYTEIQQPSIFNGWVIRKHIFSSGCLQKVRYTYLAARELAQVSGCLILHYIYKALIQSHFDYCNLVRGNCGKTLFDRLQKLQKRAARILTFSSYDADANRLIRQLGET